MCQKVAIWEGSSFIYVGYLCLEYAAYKKI